MQDEQFWAERFEQHRPRLQAMAYRMLGSLAEAEDAVQEAWLRVSRASGDDVDNVGGWLTTIVSRQCLNMLRSRAARREDPLDVRLPDPVVEFGDGVDPAEQSVLADSVGLALLVVLESLEPAQRLAFVLHDMFAMPFDEIAPMLDAAPAAARQLASRARRRVQGATPSGQTGPRAAARDRRRLARRGAAAATSPAWSRCCTRTPCCASTPAAPTPRLVRGAAAIAGQATIHARAGLESRFADRQRRTRHRGERSTAARRRIRVHHRGRADRRGRHPGRPQRLAALNLPL